MDTEISELGSGVELVDCLVWRTAYQLSVEKRKAGMDLLQSWPFPLPFYSVGICIIARISLLYSRGRVWAAPTKKQSIQCLICHAKKSKNVYKTFSHGYTINRKTDSTTLKSQSRQQNFTYLILIKKIYFPKTQDFLRPQECESISDSLSNSSAYFFAFEQCFFLAPIFVANFTHKHLLYYIAVFPQLKIQIILRKIT